MVISTLIYIERNWTLPLGLFRTSFTNFSIASSRGKAVDLEMLVALFSIQFCLPGLHALYKD